VSKGVANFSLDLDVIAEIKRQAQETDVPASRLVNKVLAAHFRKPKARA
jgi:hypothetical protein